MSVSWSIGLAGVYTELEFAPSERLVAELEKPYREDLCLNGSWRFQSVELPPTWRDNVGQPLHIAPPQPSRWDSVAIRIPSPWDVNAFAKGDGPDNRTYPSYPKQWEWKDMAWMERVFEVPEHWSGRRIVVAFEAIAGFAEIYVNDRKVGEHFDSFLPFSFDITERLKIGERNTLRVGVLRARLFNDNRTVGRRPYPGGSMWAQSIAGIWQDVYLVSTPKVYISDVFIQPLVNQQKLRLEVTLANDTDSASNVNLEGQVRRWLNLAGSDVTAAAVPKWELGQVQLAVPAQKVLLEPQSHTLVSVEIPVSDELELWSPETPHLHGLVMSLLDDKGVVDRKYDRFGWRQWSIEGNRHLLNGKPIELRGDSWHFLGVPFMSRRYAWAWYEVLKEANCNAVRLHAQVYPRFFLDVADEMGICVLDETAIWASDGGHKFDSDKFWDRCSAHVRGLVLRDRNHPSVFGWSISNENRTILKQRFRRDDLLERQVSAWREWLSICRELDPTRDWISGDGDDDGEGTLPVVMGHYCGKPAMTEWANGSKPWGVGEHSMADYGSPRQVSRFNGPRAFESMLGRMEGIAYNCYDLLKQQRDLEASYSSVFNVAGYALQPLALGKSDTSVPPSLRDGVYFTSFVEGKPGYQPERLGPYSTTLNPGYDSDRPLYRPWPMFEAIQDANALDGPVNSKWANRPQLVEPKVARAAKPAASLALLVGKESQLADQLKAFGVDLSGNAEPSLVIVDGQRPPTSPSIKDQELVGRLLTSGGTLLVWDLAPSGLARVNQLLPRSVRLTERQASSALVVGKSSVVEGLGHRDFYFSESTRQPLMEFGIEGPLVDEGNILVTACEVDWRRWNNAAGPIKAAAVVRSAAETSGGGIAVIEFRAGKGRVIVSTLASLFSTLSGAKLAQDLLQNLNVPLRSNLSASCIDGLGHLQQCLVCGSFGATSHEEAASRNFLGAESDISPSEGDVSSERTWSLLTANDSSVFQFSSKTLRGPTTNAAVYMSFWIWSPRLLTNLLSEPNIPHVDLLYGVDDSVKMWLNNEVIEHRMRVGPCVPDEFQCKRLPLRRGWNHFRIKVSQGTGEWQFSGRLHSNSLDFLRSLKSSANKPEE